MANRYLIAAGNSNNPAIYDGGTLPNPDDVLRLNNYAWTVVSNMQLAQLRCDASSPAVATNTARIVTLNNGVVLTCTEQILGINSADNGMFRAQAGGTATVVSPLLTRGISGVNTGETLNVIGFGDTTGLASSSAMIRGSGTTNWTGGFVNPAQYIIDTVSGGTVNITGNILQNGGLGVWARGNHTLTVTGDISSGSTPFYDTTATTYNAFTHYGRLVATGSGPVVRSRSLYRGTGPFINFGSYCAFAGDRLELIPNGGTFFEVSTTTPSTVRLYTPDLLSGYPAISDVESGVTYGPVGEFTGTLSPVVINTAQLATDLLTEMNTSNLTIAQGLRDGMGASAAAIAAVGSINVIP